MWSPATAQHGPGWGPSFILSLVNSWITLSRGLPDDSQWGDLEAPAGRGGPGCLQGQEGLHLGGSGDGEKDVVFNTPWDKGGCEITKAPLHGKKMPRRGGANLLVFSILAALTWPSDGHSRLRQLLLTSAEHF